MTPYASVALYKRNGAIVFRPPRKERPDSATHARKAAMRYWRGMASKSDQLVRVIVAREFDGRLEIAERTTAERAWKEFNMDIAQANEPHLAAIMAELGIDPEAAPPTVPDVLVINGQTYRRDI